MGENLPVRSSADAPQQQRTGAEPAVGHTLARGPIPAVAAPVQPQIPDQDHTSEEVDIARAREYALLAVLLARAPDAALLVQIVGLHRDETAIGRAHAALAHAAEGADAARIEREYFELFIGVGRSELLPYGSYYLTGFLHERPLARLREDLRALGIERVQGESEPEDHAGILCEIMAGLCAGPFRGSTEVQEGFFRRHLAPWLGRFFADLEHADAADFYRSVGALGRLLMEIETEFFALPA